MSSSTSRTQSTGLQAQIEFLKRDPQLSQNTDDRKVIIAIENANNAGPALQQLTPDDVDRLYSDNNFNIDETNRIINRFAELLNGTTGAPTRTDRPTARLVEDLRVARARFADQNLTQFTEFIGEYSSGTYRDGYSATVAFLPNGHPSLNRAAGNSRFVSLRNAPVIEMKITENDRDWTGSVVATDDRLFYFNCQTGDIFENIVTEKNGRSSTELRLLEPGNDRTIGVNGSDGDVAVTRLISVLNKSLETEQTAGEMQKASTIETLISIARSFPHGDSD